jgi:23S rRNA (adenine2503-C2)-methyltransferase
MWRTIMQDTDHTDGRTNLLSLTRGELAGFFAALGEKPYRATQLMGWIHQLGTTDFSAMSNIGKTLRQRLGEVAVVTPPEVVMDQTSADGTRKWLLRLRDGNCIETVFIPEEDRGTLCVSSQVGCTLNCRFCATGYQGYNRNLDTGEIVAQIWTAYKAMGECVKVNRRITNVVFMGMGEPLYNFDNVTKAIDVLLDDWGYGLSKRRVTVSTAGVVPAIDRLREVSDVSLAISLHAPDDPLRDVLVPLNKKYPIAELLAACRRYVSGKQGSRITFEYVMLDGVNDSPSQARALIALLRDVPAKINLIPFNPFPHAGYTRSSPASIDRFRDILINGHIVTITRKTRGDDISAACGQLAGQIIDKTKRRMRYLRQGAGVNP